MRCDIIYSSDRRGQMKKISTILLIFSIIGIMTVSCGGNGGVTVVGVVEQADENGFLIDVTEGYAENRMQVHITKKTDYDQSAMDMLGPGAAVGVVIEDEVMESYPVQANAIEIEWVERVVTGTVLSAGESSVLFKIEEGHEAGMLQVLIDEETVFHGGIPRILEKQKTAGFTIDVMEEPLDTDPVAVKAKRFVTYE
jgi:hypothetical protein